MKPSSIRKKLVLMTALTLAPMLVLGLALGAYLVQENYHRTQASRVASQITLVTSYIENVTALAASDVIFLSRLPAVQDLARSVLAQKSQSRPASKNREQLVAELNSILARFMSSKEVYDQARIIGADGQELVRVNLVGGMAQPVEQAKLQNKAGRYYFQEAKVLPPDKVYVSPVDLNRERGAVERPFKPMLRFEANLPYSPAGYQGMVVLNFFAAKLFQKAMRQEKHRRGIWFIIDQDGYYLYHPTAPERVFGSQRDLNTGHRCQRDFGPACQDFLEGGNGRVKLEGENWDAYAKVLTIPGLPPRRMAVVRLLPYPGVLGHLGHVAWAILGGCLGALVLALLLAVLASRGIAGPLQQLGQVVDAFSRGEFSARAATDGGGEIGRLAAQFNQMAGQLAEMYQQLESRVAERTSQLARANYELARSESTLRSVMDSTVDGIVAIDEKARITVFNRGAESIFGWRAAEVLGSNVAKLMPPDMASLHDGYVARYLSGGKRRIIGRSRELSGMRKDGVVFPLYLALGEVVVDGERIFTAVLRDISDIKAARAELENSRRQYQALTEVSPVGIFRVNSQAQCLYVNEHWSLLTGEDQSHALGKSWLEAVHPDDKAKVTELWELASKKGERFQGEFRLRGPGENITWVFGQAAAEINADGDVAGYVGTFTDVTALKKSQQGLAASEKRYRDTFDQAAVGVGHIDPEGRILDCNKRLCQIWGYGKAELLELSFQEITFPGDLAIDMSLLKKTLEGELDSYHIEKRYVRKNGEVFWADLTVALVRDANGQPDYFVSVVDDISHRKSVEAKATRMGRALEDSLNEIYIFDADDLHFIQVNRGGRENLGYTMEELSAMTPLDIKPHFTSRQFQDMVGPLRSGDLAKVRFTTVHQRKDGSTYPVEVHLQLNRGGNRDMFLANIIDLSERQKAARELERTRFSMDLADDAIFWVDAEGRFFDVNQTACQRLGYTREEMLHMGTLDLDPNFDQTLWRKHFQEVKKTGSLRLETRHRRKNGEQFPVEVSVHHHSYQDREFLCAIARDITKRKKDQAEINRLSMVAQRTRNAVIIIDGEGRAQWVNQAFTRISGYAPEEILGKNPGDVLHGPETDPQTVAFMEEKLKRGEGFTEELVNYAKDGSKFWLDLDVQPVLDEQGRAVNFVAVQSDITQRKQTEQALRLQAQIIEQTHDSVVTTDIEGLITSWNQGAKLLFGFSQQEALGKHVSLVYGDEEKERLEVQAMAILQREGQYEGEVNLVRRDGHPFAAHLSLSILKDSQGEPYGMVAYCLDITARKQAEAAMEHAREEAEAARLNAERANLAKSDFLANMSHELRTPLNAIIGFSEILLDQSFGELNPNQDRQVKHILSSGQHLLTMINDVLELAKAEGGRTKLNLSSVNLNRVLQGSLVLLRDKAARHGINMALDIAPDLQKAHITADELKLKQIMYNLLSNAVKYSPDQGSVRVKAWAKDEVLTVSVADKGSGISPEDQEKVFGQFVLLDSSYNRANKGAGIGLAVTKRLVELHGGRIWVESEGLGNGSTFFFQIPLPSSPPALAD